MHVVPQPVEATGSSVVLCATLSRTDKNRDSESLWYRVPRDLEASITEDCDAFVDRKKKPRFPFFAGYGRYVKPRMRPRPGPHCKAG